MLAAVAQSLLRIAHRAHHGRKLRRVQAGFVVRPFQRFVQGKVLFNDARAKRHGRDVGLPAQRVVGIPHRAAEMGRQVLHGAQVRVREWRGIFGIAVQQRNILHAAVLQHGHRVLNFRQRTHACGEDDRFFQRGDPFQIGQVRDLSGRDLVYGQLQRRQEIDAVQIKGRGEVFDADLLAVSFQLPVAVKAEVDAAHHLLAFRLARLRLLVFGLFGKFAHDQLRHRRLVFYDIRPCSFCRKGHFFCARKAAVVVHARLRDDEH